MTLEIFTLINVILVGLNICILGLAVKMYSEVTKTHIFTKPDRDKKTGL